MTGPVLRVSPWRVAWYRFRATFRHRWSGYLALAVLIGLVGGVAMGSVVAARRTYSSYPTFLASTNPSDLIVVPPTNGYSPDLRAQLARLPLVRNAEGTDQFNAVTLTPRGGIGTVLITQVELVASPAWPVLRPGPGHDRAREGGQPGTLQRGRGHHGGRRVLGLHVGSRLPVGIDENGAGKITPFHRKLDLTVVGLGRAQHPDHP